MASREDFGRAFWGRVMINLPAMTAQLSGDAWQKLAEETRCELVRVTNLRNLLNVEDLADIAVACDRKALLTKWVDLRDTFMNLGERYRALAREVSQQNGSFPKPHVEEIAPRRLAA